MRTSRTLGGFLAALLLATFYSTVWAQINEPYTQYLACGFSGDVPVAGLYVDLYGDATKLYRKERLIVTPGAPAWTTAVINAAEPRAAYRVGFDFRRPTTSPTNALEVRLRRYWSPTVSTFYRIQTTDNFVSNVTIARVQEGTSPSSVNLTLSSLPAWTSSQLNSNYWQRVEATIEDLNGKPTIRLYIDGRLRAEASDTSASALTHQPGNSWNVFTQTGQVELDNFVVDNYPTYAGNGAFLEEAGNHQEFANVTFNNAAAAELELGYDIPLDTVDQRLEADAGSGFKQLYLRDDNGLPLNLTDYAFSLDVSYRNSSPNGTQNFIVRRQWDNFSAGGYGYARNDGYFLRTTNRLDSFSLHRMTDGGQTQVVANIDGLAGPLAYGAVARLKIVANGKYLDFYLNGKRIHSYVETSVSYPKTGGASVWTDGADVNFDNVLVETDYYFWKKKGNDLLYRGQARIPNGYNTVMQEGACGWGIDEYLDEPNPTIREQYVAEPKRRLRIASASGARTVRMLPRVGYVPHASEPYFLWADLFYAMDHTVKFAKWDYGIPSAQPAHESGTLPVAGFVQYFDEIVSEARRNDLFIEFVLMDHQADCWKRTSALDPSGKGVPFPSAGGVTGTELDSASFLTSTEVFVAFASRASSLINYYRDEGIIFSWEMFNEPLANVSNVPSGWFFPSGSYNWSNAANFFRYQAMVLGDVYRAEAGLALGDHLAYRTSDKHLVSSGIHGGPIAGYLYPPNSGTVGTYNPALSTKNEFCDFEGYVDSHSYGSTVASLKASLLDLRNNRGLSGKAPIRVGEVGIGYDYQQFVCAGLGCLTNGKNHLAHFNGINYVLAGCTTGIYPRQWKQVTANPCSPGAVLPAFDGDPRYLSLAQRYAIWQPWLESLTTEMNTNNISILLWSLDTHSGINYPSDYNPATHGVYSPFDSWITINAEEPNLHRGFLKHSAKSWGR